MSDPLFDRYREALRAGHVAVLRGRLEDARRPIERPPRSRAIAPCPAPRSAPWSCGSACRSRRWPSFDTALALAPADDSALVGRAQALVVLQRPDEAAATYDLLADARWAAGKRPDAGDALRRALEIQPTPVRRQRYRDLADELRAGRRGRRGGPPRPRPALPRGRARREPDAGRRPTTGIPRGRPSRSRRRPRPRSPTPLPPATRCVLAAEEAAAARRRPRRGGRRDRRRPGVPGRGRTRSPPSTPATAVWRPGRTTSAFTC